MHYPYKKRGGRGEGKGGKGGRGGGGGRGRRRRGRKGRGRGGEEEGKERVRDALEQVSLIECFPTSIRILAFLPGSLSLSISLGSCKG